MSTKNTKPKPLTKKKMTPKSQNQDAVDDADGKKDLLKGVVAFVDVKAEGIETSEAISKKIEEYGGKVQKTLGKTITHVIFKDGKQSTWRNSTEKELKVISPQWIDECLKKNEVVDFDDFMAKEPETKSSVKSKKVDTPKKRKTDENEDSPKKKKKVEKSDDEKEEPKKAKVDTKKVDKKKEKNDSDKEEEKEEKVEKKKVLKKVVKKTETKTDDKKVPEKKKVEKKEIKKDEKKTTKKVDKKEDKKKATPKKSATGKKKKEKDEEEDGDAMEEEEEFVGEDDEEEEEGKTFDETDEDEESEEEEDVLEEGDELESSPQKVNSDLKKFEKKRSQAKYIFEISNVDELAKDTIEDIISSKSDSSLAVYPGQEYEGERFDFLISDSDKRTLKVLFAIAMGVEIVNSNWILEKVIENGFVDAKDYVRKKYLKEIEASKESKSNPDAVQLFHQRRFCLLGDLKPKKIVLERLIEACGGKVVSSVRRCNVAICGEGSPPLCLSDDDSFISVNVNWLFDAVGSYEIPKDTKKYQITKEQVQNWEKSRKSPKNSAKKLSKKDEKMVIEEQDGNEEEEIENFQVEVDPEVDDAMNKMEDE